MEAVGSVWECLGEQELLRAELLVACTTSPSSVPGQLVVFVGPSRACSWVPPLQEQRATLASKPAAFQGVQATRVGPSGVWGPESLNSCP